MCVCVCSFTPQSVQLLNDVQTTFLQLQAECEKLKESNRCLLESSRRNESHLEVNCQILSSKQDRPPLNRLHSVRRHEFKQFVDRPGTDHNCPFMFSLLLSGLFFYFLFPQELFKVTEQLQENKADKSMVEREMVSELIYKRDL